MVNAGKLVHMAVGPESMPPVPVLLDPVELVEAVAPLEVELPIELEVEPVDDVCVDVPLPPPPPLAPFPVKSNVPRIEVQALAAPVAAAKRRAMGSGRRIVLRGYPIAKYEGQNWFRWFSWSSAVAPM
jgi:hypothetical protein